MLKRLALILSVAAALCPFARAQYQTQAPADSGNPMPEFRSNVVSRSTPAVSYRHRSGSTKIDFQGTDLMHGAMGQAKVASKRGALSIDAEFSGLDRPTSLGHEYLTYVLWAISPEGRPVNIGEVLVGDNHRSKLYVTTDLQSFAMTAKYEMIDRGGYLPTGYKFDPVVLNAGLPLEFFEARNAIRIAQSAGAEQYATESYRKAVRQMDEADSMAIRKHENKKSLIAVSREVVEKAEDAREISVKHIDEDRLAHERSAGANREASANNRADDEAQRRAGAEADTAEAQRRRREADRNNLDAQSAAMQAAGAQAGAERDRDAAQHQQQAAEAESDRNRANAASSDAQLQQAAGAQANAERDRNTAERDRNDAQQQQRAAEAESDRNRANAVSSTAQLQQAVRDREEIRARLLAQFNLILETRDTARGLVVNMSDVLFDSGKYTLRPLAREKLAKISGIVLAYPTLRLAVEGNTDSVGTESFNQRLSEQRAEGVRSFLTAQGVPEASTTAAGFGKARPIASNETSEGRQQNRRVELVVSGEVIGTKIVSLYLPPVADARDPQ
jgi:outer membrane protein OmpA-like peptidoglycan-associated protein